MQLPLSGIIPPMITPLVDRDTLDLSGLEHLIDHLIAGGVHGIFVLGTTGEAPSLSYRLRREVIDQTCRITAGRVPVLVGISDTSVIETIALAEVSADAGAAALVLAPPYYLPPSQNELCDYVYDLMPELPLPLVLYNMPGLTNVPFGLTTVAELMQHDGIIGMKDSSGDMKYLQGLLMLARDREDFCVLVGPEELTAEGVLMGAHGGVSGGANLAPRLYVDLYEAAARLDVPRTRELQREVMQLSQRLYGLAKTRGGWILAIKGALAELGICRGRTAPPLRALTPAEQAHIREHLIALKLLSADVTTQGALK